MDEELMNIITEENVAVEPADIIESEVTIEDEEFDASVVEAMDEVSIEPDEIVEIAVDEAIGWVGGDSDRHYSLLGRNDPDQHEIKAITGLRSELDEIERLKTVYSDKSNVATYYKWKDASYDEYGYFVSMVPGASIIKICDGSDIFGVSVNIAGFIGGQDVSVPRDNSYGLIVTSGLVDVRCELDVEVGDYITSNNRGYAKKSDSDYGYKVLSKVNKQGVEYAVIMLGVQADVINSLGVELSEVEERVSVNETNIVSAVNVANQAYNKASAIGISNQKMSVKIDGALGIVDKVVSDVENLGTQVSNSALTSAQAKAIAESAATSAESMRNEAVEKANEALAENSELRKEFETKIIDIDTKLENSALELQAMKESIEGTRTELQENINGVSKDLESTQEEFQQTNASLKKDLEDAQKDIEEGAKNLKDTKKELEDSLKETIGDIEALEKDLIPLKTWPEGATGDDIKGIAGFVARADSDSVTLGNLVTWKDGDGDESLAGFVSNATSENAEIKALAEYTYTDKDGNEHKSVAALDAYADENKAAIDAIVGTGGSLAGLQTQVDKNAASVATLASHIVGEYTTVETWSTENKDIAQIYYAEDTRNYWYYDNGWKFTDKSYETKPPLSGALAGIQQTADDNTASIEMITNLEGDFGESLAGLVSKTTEENAEIKALAEYKYTDKDGKEHTSVAALDAYADDNKASIDAIVGKDGKLAGLQAQVDANKASVATLASQTIGEYIVVDTWSATSKDTNKIYYAKNTKYYYYYKNSKWVATKDISEAGLGGSIAGVKSTADANKAELDAVASYEKDGKKGLAGLTAQVDENKTELATVATYEAGGKKGLAGLVAQVDADKAIVQTIAELDGGIAGLDARIESNTSSVTALASQAIGDYTVVDEWNVTDKDTTKIYYAKDAKDYLYYKNGKWNRTKNTFEAGLDGAVAGVQSVADKNQADLNALASYQAKDENGNPIYSVAGITAHVDKNSAQASILANYSKTDKNGNVVGSGAAGLIAQVDETKAVVSTLATLDGDVGGLIAQVAQNTTDVALVSKHVSGKYSVIDSWDPNGKDINTVYYVKDANENKDDLYYYYKDGWKFTTDAYTAGLPSSVGGIQIVSDDHSSRIGSLVSWQGTTNTAMARIEQKADANGAYIQSTVSNMDKYAVGPHSQAYGFTLEQAASVLEEGMIYVPTVSVTEEYSYTDASQKTQTYKRTFTPQYLYKWGKVRGQYRWITVDKNYNETTETNTSSKAVYFTTTNPAVSGNFGYWYTNGNSVTDGYDPYTLYKWDSYTDESGATQYQWVAVATLAGNSQSRAVSQIRQDANSIIAEVTDARGGAASLGIRVTNTESEVQSLASWTKDDKGNQYNLATIKQTADEAGANIALVVQEKDGEKVVNSASIVAAINDDESSVGINADRITMTGTTTFLKPGDVGEDGGTIIDGARIQTGTISADRLDLSGTLTVSEKKDLVSFVEVFYARSSSLTNFVATTEWSSVAPEWAEDEYMWQKTIITYADHTETTPHQKTTTTCIHGKNGTSPYLVRIDSTNGNIFKNGEIETTLTATVLYGDKDVTNDIAPGRFVWTRVSADTQGDVWWNEQKFKNRSRQIKVTSNDVRNRATFFCTIEDE